MTFETADDVLEHFGVKGMKWGVRKKSSSGGRTKAEKKPLTPRQQKARSKARKEALKGAGVGAVKGLAIGLLAVGWILAQDGQMRIGDFGDLGGSSYRSTRPSGSSRPRTAADIINQERETQLSSLRRTHREGHLDADQLRMFEEKLNRRYDRRVAEAGGN